MRYGGVMQPLYLMLAGLLWGTAFAEPPKALDKTTVMAYLPKDATLADDIPVLQWTPKPEEMYPPLLSADIDGDGQNETIVAYYTAPHTPLSVEATRTMPPEEAAKYDKAYYSRAHVRVLHWNGSIYDTQWDSGGFGSRFIGGMGESVPVERQKAYSSLYFAVLDVTGDGIPAIVCTRSSFTAEGTEFEVWHWNGKTYGRVLWLGMMPRLADAKSASAKFFIEDRDLKGNDLEPPVVYEWKQDQNQFIKASAPPENLEVLSAQDIAKLEKAVVAQTSSAEGQVSTK